MPLSSELVSQFAKLASNKPKEEKESTVYGTTVIQNGNKYVKLDGSELLTPASFTTNIADGERVTVLIKNHMAIVTGNITSPAARTSEVEEVGDKVDAAEAAVKDLTADNLKVNQRLEAQDGSIKNLTSDNVTIKNKLNAQEASIGNLEAENVTITGKLDAAEGNISSLQADNVTINESLTAAKASIEELDTKKLSADQADIKYANIDFTNIGKAAIENFYATSGIIKDLVIGDTSVTGKLVGVTIIGDLIEGGTVKADKLVVKGSDGLFYKLNTDGISITAEQTDYNSLNGSILTAKSVTAEKVNVKDLVAFDATIGGFKIGDSSLYSGAKESVDNTTAGIFMDKTGQMAVGDSTNFIKFYKDTDGSYKLAISADSLTFSTGQTIKDGINGKNGVSVISIVRYYMIKTSSQETPPDKPTTNPPSDSWSNIEPDYNPNGYLYFVDLTTFSDGSFSYSDVSLSSTYSAVKDAEKKAEEAKAKANNTQNSLDETNHKLKTYFDFGDDLTIRKENSPFKISISKEEIQIKQDTELIQKFDKDGNGIIPKLKVTLLLNLMGYQLEKDSAGNLNCVYVGGDT